MLFPQLITYDLEGNSWSSYPGVEGLAPIQHHNRFIDSETNTLVVFGGYGNHAFKANLACHSLSGGDWNIHSLAPEVAPRFLSAAGYLGNGKFLVMGGFGSLSGKQEESPRNFDDLYAWLIDKHLTALIIAKTMCWILPNWRERLKDVRKDEMKNVFP